MAHIFDANNRKRIELKDQKRVLEIKREGLGLFKGKEKADITRKIAEIDSQLAAIETDQEIHKRYQARIDELSCQEEIELTDAIEDTRSEYTILSIDEFQV